VFMTNLWATKQKSKDFRPILGRMQQNSGFFAKLPPALTSPNPNLSISIIPHTTPTTTQKSPYESFVEGFT